MLCCARFTLILCAYVIDGDIQRVVQSDCEWHWVLELQR